MRAIATLEGTTALTDKIRNRAIVNPVSPHSTNVDVIIVGAGLSGIGAAHQIMTMQPEISLLILEGREQIGGTWDMFRFPGIRSDSDIYTLSYPFKPWHGRKSIVEGADIRDYIQGTADEYKITEHIRFGSKAISASWSTEHLHWTVTVEAGDTTAVYTCSFLFGCSGYYDYEKGYTPDIPGLKSFQGEVVHPQSWPEDLDVSGKRVIVVGSGATAVTLVPSLAARGAQVTMLQRSPTYIISLPATDVIADVARRFLPARFAHRALRIKNAALAVVSYVFCRKFPSLARRVFLGLARRAVPRGLTVEDISPRYKPWDQRICVVPEGDLWKAIRDGKASIVTDTIDQVDSTGISLTSKPRIEADIIVTATGLSVVALGKIALDIDGQAVDLTEHYFYKGVMLSGLPNLAWCIGYATGEGGSWTLRADLSWRYVARLLGHMRQQGYAAGMPDPNKAPAQTAPPFNLTSGYLQRAADILPKQGVSRPWTFSPNWFVDSWDNRRTNLDEGMVWFERDGRSQCSDRYTTDKTGSTSAPH